MNELDDILENEPDSLFDRMSKIINGVEARRVLPQQFFHPASPYSGDIRLRYETLSEGIKEFRKYASPTAPEHIEIFDQAYNWVVSGDIDWPFSFVNLCETFGIDSDAARSVLLRWYHAQKNQDT